MFQGKGETLQSDARVNSPALREGGVLRIALALEAHRTNTLAPEARAIDTADSAPVTWVAPATDACFANAYQRS